VDARVHTDDGGITGMVRRRLRTEEVAEEEALVDAFGRDSIVRNNALDRRPPRGAFAGSASPAASASTSTAPPRVSREFRDAAGDPFTVELSNEDAPAGLTKIELRGVDRANLLGALCSSLARANISVVSGVIATDPDGRVRNTMFVRKSPPGDRIGIGARGPVGSVVDGPSSSSARLDEREFADVSLRILSACWTSDEREWLRPPPASMKFLSRPKHAPPRRAARYAPGGGRRESPATPGAATKNGGGAFFGGGSSSAAKKSRFASLAERALAPPATTGAAAELLAAEARTRAVSARLAAAASRRANGHDGFADSKDLRAMLTEMEEAVAEVAEARARAAAGPSLVAGYDGEGYGELTHGGEGTREGLVGVLPGGSLFPRAPSSNALSNALSPAAEWFSGVDPFFKGVFYMNVASLLFGSNQTVIKQVADAGVDDFTQMFLRFAVALVPLVPFVTRGASMPGAKEMLRGAAHLGTILAVGYFLQIVGLEGTSSAKGALTSTFTVLSVPVFAGLSGQRVPWYTWPASVVACAGVALLTGGDGSAFTDGDAICILAAVVFGYHTLRSSEYAAKFEDAELPFISFQILVVAVESGLWKLGEVAWMAHADPSAPGFLEALAEVPARAAALPWGPIAYMGLATTSFTLWIEFLALQNVSASMCALIYTAEPMWGALFAWTFMGDRWGPAGWAGAALIVCASAGSQFLSFRDEGEENRRGDEKDGDALLTENFSKY